MHFSTLFAAAAATVVTTQASYIGFNYGSTFTDGSAKAQSDFEAEFNRAKSLQGTNGEFTSARLYTMIQGGTTDTPISAIPAAIDTQTTLLLGLWASAGQADFSNEITALTSAITQYGSDFTSLIAGISVGSEDLYRISPTGIENDSGAGAEPSDIVSYISQVRSAIAGTSASGASVGHVDTWTAWVNGTNDAVISAVDWLGVDAYPYFQNTIANGIDVGNATFFEAYDNTVNVAQGKSVWVTETGWPVSGPQENQAVASVANAETYWQEVGCTLFGEINTWWYILQDAQPTTPSPSFGIIGSDLSAAPLYNLTCSSGSNGLVAASSAASSSATSSAILTASSASKPASASGSNTESLSNAAPGPETSPASASISQTTATSVASESASGSAATSVVAPSGNSAASTMTSEVVASSAVNTGGKTYTTHLTTMITITNCPSGCSSTAESSASSPVASASGSAPVYSSGSSQSAPAPTSTASLSSASVGTALPTPASSSATTPAAASGSSCPANLNGEYQYPHLIVPVNSAEPDTAYGTQYNGTITPTMSTIFNFDLPASYAGETCSLVFLFPEQAALDTSAFTFNGQGGISVNELSSPATQQTTYNNVSKAAIVGIGSIASVQPGNSYVAASHACNAGATQSFEFVSTGGLDLEYFEDWNAPGIGAFITVC